MAAAMIIYILSLEFMDNLSFLVENVSGCSRGEVRKAIKMIEK